METEVRYFRPSEELRVVETEGSPTKIVGLAAPYGALSHDLGGFRERFSPGAFAESLRTGRDMRADIEHDRKVLLARTSKGTLGFHEDSRGLWATITVPGTRKGQDAVEDVRNGNFDAMSVSFRRGGVEDQFVEQDGETIREITKAELTGVALTAYPAYPQTAETVDLRSFEAYRTTQEKGSTDQDEVSDSEVLRRRLDLAEAMLD